MAGWWGLVGNGHSQCKGPEAGMHTWHVETGKWGGATGVECVRGGVVSRGYRRLMIPPKDGQALSPGSCKYITL